MSGDYERAIFNTLEPKTLHHSKIFYVFALDHASLPSPQGAGMDLE